MKGIAVIGVLASACGQDRVVANTRCTPQDGIVTRVLDGDTVELQDGTKVRYLLVDTPERGATAADDECLAAEATGANEQIVLGREVQLLYDGDQCTDMFGRLLAYVEVDGRVVNRVLLERGYASVAIERASQHPEPYVYEVDFLSVEARARDAAAGIWGACQ